MAATETDVELVQRQAAAALAKLPMAEALRTLLEQPGNFDRRVWSVAQESGWLAVGVPEKYAGLGMGLAERCALAEEFGHSLGSAPFTATSCALAALAYFGSDEQKARWFAAAAEGVIGTLACFEPGDGGVPALPKLQWRSGRLYGHKVAVCAGAFAGFALVPARDDRGDALVTIADLAAAGLTKVCGDTLDNSRGYASVTFDGVPAEPLAGDAVVDHILVELALMTAFEQIGGAQACLDVTRDFACERRAFGQPIGAFQSIKHGLADIYVLIQVARGAAFAALRAEAADRIASAAAARLAATRAYDQAAQEAIQIHGGLGCAFEGVHHLHYRRARSLALEWAGPQYWRERLLREVLSEESGDIGRSDRDAGSSDERLGPYRERVAEFLMAHAVRFSGAARQGLSREQDVALGRAWQRLKWENGFAAITLPKRYGGAGGTHVQKIIFAEQESRYDLPTHYFGVSLSNPIPIMAACATEEQKDRLIAPAVRGETIWCQLFSEPSAGSDLAAARLSARLEGTQWRLNGQKLWTSWAQLSDYGVIVARSDPNVPKHLGLTYFFLDMRSPGVRVRPIKLLSGSSHVCEVFFDDVVVPDEQRLGPVGGGFKVALQTLMIERYSVMDVWGQGPDLATLLAALLDHTLNEAPVLADSTLRELIAEAIVEERALSEINYRAFTAIQAGREPGPEGSINKLLIANKRQKLARIVMDVLGPQALELPAGATSHENFTASWLSAPLLRVAGGTDQILRNTIAERILGLPQDHRPDKGVPFNQLPT